MKARRLLIILLLLTLLRITSFAEVITWKVLEGFDSGKYYSVRVNGVKTPVFDIAVASWASFDFRGKVTVDVTTIY